MLLLATNFAFAQQNITLSSTSEITAYKFDVIQNEAASFSMVISPDEVLENEEDAQFIVFTNSTSNALFVQNNDKEALFEVQLLDADKQVVVSKKDLKEIMLLDLSIYSKGSYTIKLIQADKEETHKLILR